MLRGLACFHHAETPSLQEYIISFNTENSCETSMGTFVTMWNGKQRLKDTQTHMKYGIVMAKLAFVFEY